jgi:hypothetical protein
MIDAQVYSGAAVIGLMLLLVAILWAVARYE